MRSLDPGAMVEGRGRESKGDSAGGTVSERVGIFHIRFLVPKRRLVELVVVPFSVSQRQRMIVAEMSTTLSPEQSLTAPSWQLETFGYLKVCQTLTRKVW
ncbi:uncharacterized protein KD926_002563 [Aspergillus affinis]|uniref:uncharacterized protein n=1 Tax=Aspergillus affinis TaxID=1070780 RepID=UPI0022FDC27D|nr:uncharacterized protein KD926_002563 [Aspergillus affinis]KAI9035998.1 hypothetical protein KD926_002563 [Aspergillus affinis]